MSRLTHYLALPILAGALAFGQGAMFDKMSKNDASSYDGVALAIVNSKTNTYELQRSWLMFDRFDQVRVVNRFGAELKIPYNSIKEVEFSFYNPLDSMKPAKHSGFGKKIGGKRYLIVRYDLGSGMESKILAMDADQYQQIMGSFQAKTGVLVSHPGGYEKHW